MTFDDATVYASLAMILFGMIATITWDAFYLDSRDEVVLGSLPVSSRLLAAAKLASLGVFLGRLHGGAERPAGPVLAGC